MEAVVVQAPGRASVQCVPDPVPGPREIVVRVAACGICGTDLHIYGGSFLPHYPLTPGHEFSGTVAAVGAGVPELRPGDRVAVDPSIYCQDCDYCRQNKENHCLHWAALGDTTDGGFAEYVRVPARNAYLLPRGLSLAEAAFVEPLSCVVYALRRANLPLGASVLVAGAGPMGILLTQLARHGGASSITVTDVNPRRLRAALDAGATHAVPAGPDRDGALRDAAPRGFDAVIDATGSPAVIEGLFDHLGKEGTFLQFGVCPPEGSIALRPFDIYHNDWRIIGSFALRYTFLPARDLLTAGAVEVLRLVSHVLPLPDYERAIGLIRDGQAVKVLLSPDPAALLADLRAVRAGEPAGWFAPDAEIHGLAAGG